MLGPLLGKGGMGEVLEAWDVVLCRTVALKALRNMEPAAMIRFMHEAQIQARVVHPNICRIYDIESSEGTLKIAMQLIKGPNLEQAARQLTLDEVVGILCQVAEGVHAAHRVNLIHRDLKPSNIILERSQDGHWVPYLCDFGLAVAMGEPAMTMSQAVVGTPAFMAPEQTQGDRSNISPATDVYALGGTLHFALVGYPPGRMGTTSTRGLPKAGLPRDLEVIIRKCLEEDPARRYPTAAALAEELWRFRNGEPIHARPRRRGLGLPPLLPRRGRRLLAAVSAVALAALGFAAWLGRDLQSRFQDEALVLEALEQAETTVSDFKAEEALPVHDLRPFKAKVRERASFLLSRTRNAGKAARGAGWYGAGRCYAVIGAFPEARAAMDKAAGLGFLGRDLPSRLVRLEAGASCWNPEADPPPGAALAPDDHDQLQEASVHFLRRNYIQAASDAHIAGEAHTALREPAVLEAAALAAIAHEHYRAGDMAGAQARFQEAAALVKGVLAQWRSCAALHHAYARTTLGLVELLQERGLPTQALIKELRAGSDLALGLDPDAPELREDWLAARFLQARADAAQGRDPSGPLGEAVAYFQRGKEPATPGLKALRMLVHWQLAERSSRHGEDPGPALVEALRSQEPTRGFNRDYLPDVLLTQASLELTRGRDPRPTLELALARLQPGLQDRRSWAPLESAGEAFWLRTLWETHNALDPTEALAKVHEMADQALRIFPAAPVANTLVVLALDLEMKRDPARKALLLPAARGHQKLARSGMVGGPLGTLLRLDPSGRS